jgi:glycosyltransferase involved in cell wall biosynthesis
VPFFGDDYIRGLYDNNVSKSAVLKAYISRLIYMLRVSQFDMVWVEKEMLPWVPGWIELGLFPASVPLVVDYDDAVFHRYDQHRLPIVRSILGRKIDKVMKRANLVVAGNEYLANRARSAGASRVEILPTVIDLDRYSPQPTADPGENVPRIVWIGSPSTAQYLKLIHKPLLALGERCTFKLRMIGARLELPGVDVEYLNWSEATEVSSIQSCQVGVMPLLDSPWERGKCGYKLIQYMACGLPVVASPVGVNSVIVREGVNGFLASADEEWAVALETLIRDAALRQRMGSAGRQRVEDEYCVQQTAPRLIQWLKFVGES